MASTGCECARQLFQAALSDETLLPVRCCAHPLAEKFARLLLNQAELALLTAKMLEIQVECTSSYTLAAAVEKTNL